MKLNRENWTRDANGNPVDWTSSEFGSGCQRSFCLPGEHYHELSAAERQKRLAEYYAILAKRSREYYAILAKRSRIEANEALAEIKAELQK